MIKKFAWTHVAVMLLGAALAFSPNASQKSASYLAASGLMLINVGLLYWVWQRCLQKKLVALAILIIVFKYAILGWIVYRLLSSSWLDIVWFSMGIGSLILSSSLTALQTRTSEDGV